MDIIIWREVAVTFGPLAGHSLPSTVAQIFVRMVSGIFPRFEIMEWNFSMTLALCFEYWC